MSRHLQSIGPHAAQLSTLSTFELFNAALYSRRLTPFLSHSSALFRSFRQNRIFAALCFQAVAHSLKMCISATPFASATSALFAKNRGVGGPPAFPSPRRPDAQTSSRGDLFRPPWSPTHSLTSARTRVTIAVAKRGNRLPAASVLRLSSPLGRRWG